MVFKPLISSNLNRGPNKKKLEQKGHSMNPRQRRAHVQIREASHWSFTTQSLKTLTSIKIMTAKEFSRQIVLLDFEIENPSKKL